MDSALSLQDAISTLPLAVRVWVTWLNIVVFGATAVFLVYRETRLIGIVFAALTAAMAFAVQLLYAEFGLVRLLGLPHLVLWGPFVIWLALRLRRGGLRTIPRIVAWILLASLVVSLLFDAADVLRWSLGDRGSLSVSG